MSDVFDHSASDNARLEINARGFKYDPDLEPVADAMDRGDYATWSGYPRQIVDRASLYRDFRATYRRAVQAGAIPDDRNAQTYEENR